MGVGVDDIANGFAGAGADGREQPATLLGAAAGVDDRDGIVADDESQIGNRAFVVMAHDRERADMNEHSRRRFRDCEGLGKLRRVATGRLLRVGSEMDHARSEH